MNLARRLIFRSLVFHARGHLGTLLGVTVAGAVLVGALAVGDCVRESLRQMALARLGRTDFALVSRDRFFRDTLGPAAVLQLPGIAVNAEKEARANHVQILGVNEHFWALAQTPPAFANSQDESVVLNAPLAAQLHVKVGDTILLRAQKPSVLSLDAPLAPQEDVTAGFRLPVSAIVSDAEFGRFGLQASQIPPLNAFVPLKFLQKRLGMEGKANLLLAEGAQPPELRGHWTLADAELEMRPVPGGSELRSERVFLDPPVARVAEAAGARMICTYFVNELRAGSNTTPYSMVTAAGPPLVPADLGDDEILISQWLADDLHAKPGDELALKYFVLGATRRLEEKQDHFRIRAILPMDNPAMDRTLLPDFPGIAKAEKTANWDAGFPIDMNKIRPQDEQYWKDYRGTPKALVNLKAGQRMWGNRFGDWTAARFSGGAPDLLSKLDPASVGLSFQPVRAQALAASSQSQDFGELFLYFSFFLIAAALILLALLFQFGLEKRATEIGVLLALGMRPRQVRRLLLGEGLVIAVIGGLLGVGGGILYAKGILHGLSTLWSAAVANSALSFHVTLMTLITGGAASVLISMAVIWLGVRSQAKRPARELLEQGNEMEPAKPKRHWAGWVAILSGLCAAGMVGSALWKHDTADVEAFFSGGALLLISGIASAAVWLREPSGAALSITALGLRNCARHRKRSVATLALLASGSFLIIAVEANKLDAHADSSQRSSGTGGFALIGESSLPVVQDLNAKAGREFFGLDEQVMQDAQIVPMRVRDGDDASCLNLNRAQTPRLLGVRPELLTGRFTTKSWRLLAKNDSAIPAFADDATITWALGKKIGDTVDFTDEHGKPFQVQLAGLLANSILQGNLIIDEAEFVKKFPGESGYRMFLVDAPSNEAAQVAAALTRGLQDRGLELTPAADRLNAFNAVQNTYLNTFQVLGALGLLLGSAGLGAVALRNVLERRGELAVLSAVGFRAKALRWLVLSEHGALQCLGLLAGIIAALLAVLPALLSPGASLSYGTLAGALGLIFASGLLWTWIAARLALRGKLLEALRNE